MCRVLTKTDWSIQILYHYEVQSQSSQTMQTSLEQMLEQRFDKLNREIMAKVEALEHKLDQKIGELDRKAGECRGSNNGNKSIYSYVC